MKKQTMYITFALCRMIVMRFVNIRMCTLRAYARQDHDERITSA